MTFTVRAAVARTLSVSHARSPFEACDYEETEEEGRHTRFENVTIIVVWIIPPIIVPSFDPGSP